MSDKLNLTLKVWRQEDNSQTGDFVTYPVTDVNPHMSFLELLDVLNEKLIGEGGDPIAFEHDCREGICGSCAMNINGCLLYTSPSPRDRQKSRMPSSA